MTNSTTPHDPLIPMRLVLILLTSLVIGATIGILTYMAVHVVASAILAGLVAFGASVPVLDKLIGR